MLSVDSQKKVEQLLIERNALSTQELDKMKAEAASANKPLMALLVERNVIDEEELTKLIAEATEVPYVNLKSSKINEDILQLVPKDIAQQFMAVPIGYVQGRLAVAMLDPNNVQAVDFISQKIGKPITVYMASQDGINQVLKQYSSNLEKEVTSAIQTESQTDLDTAPAPEAGPGKPQDIATIVQDSPITRALKSILDYAAEANASDIHIEPMEDELKIRVRVDGILREIMTLPKSIEPALVSRVKILSNLKIDEHRVPQDGQFQVRSGDQEFDIRVAVAPVVWGEQVVLRLLDQGDEELALSDLGLRGKALELVKEGSNRPHGMILSTGPTGSGKSTTLYTVLQMIKDNSINIVTLEDPVERKIEGVNQIQINPAVGLTFASGLRSVLRQDPDVVLVGEIRDKETATLAVQAALTGHLVLSTLHTNSAAGVLPRLLDMDIEPFLIASTVNTVIGQRLVRKVCEKQQSKHKSTPTETKTIQETVGDLLPKKEEAVEKVSEKLGYENLPLADQNAYTLYEGKDTDECPGGYKGRIGIFEVYSMSDALEELLTQHATTSEIQQQAVKQGMISMKRDGYLKALSGITTLEEVARVAADY